MSILVLLSMIFSGAALALLLLPRFPAAPVAFVAMLLAYFGVDPEARITDVPALWTWGATAFIVTALFFAEPRHARGMAHLAIALGAAAGTAVGFACLPSSSGMVIGATGGTLLGALLFSRTPAGRSVPVTSRSFVAYVCDTGFAAIDTCVILGLNLVQVFMR